LKFDDNRKIINDNFINDNQDVCNILPDELFTIENDGRASMDNMIDSIHYNKDISFGIKRLIKEKCGVEL
jgi:DNA-directed RNA polymerase alpha subunit